MKKTRKLRNALLSTLVAAGLASVTPAALANLLINGDFETGSFSGWTQSGNLRATYVSDIPVFVQSDMYGAALGASGSDGILSQSFSTVAGAEYRLTFWLYSDGRQVNDFSAAVNSRTLYSQVNIPAQAMKSYTYDFVGTGFDSVTFKFRNDRGYLGMDTVSVDKVADPAPIPEPASLALIGLGLAGIARRRRRARAAGG